MVRWRAQRDCDVVRHLVARDRDDRRVMNRPVREHRDVRGAATDVAQAHAEFLFVVREHCVRGRELLQDDVIHVEAATLHAFYNVLRGADRACHHVDARFQAHARHADRFAYAFLAIDDEFLRQHVEDFLVRWNRDGARGVDHAFDIGMRDLAVLDRDDAVRVEAADVSAGDAGIDGLDLAASHQLRLLDRALDRLHGGFDVDHHALLQAPRRMRAQAHHLDRAVRQHFADDGDDLGSADVQPDYQILVLFSDHACFVCLAPPLKGRVIAWRTRHHLPRPPCARVSKNHWCSAGRSPTPAPSCRAGPAGRRR